jgi:hypothetical protein
MEPDMNTTVPRRAGRLGRRSSFPQVEETRPGAKFNSCLTTVCGE